MSDLISRKALIDSLYSCEELKGRRVIEAVANTIKEQPTVEAVPKSYADQIRWERDIAIEQLNEIGCQFGQKMDEVKKKLELVHAEWIDGCCSNCGAYIPTDSFWDYISEKECNFCYFCGCDMRTSAE